MNIQKIMSSLEAKHPGESEYLQAVKEVLLSIEDIYNQHPEFEKAKIIERLVEPDRIFTFRAVWKTSMLCRHTTMRPVMSGSPSEICVPKDLAWTPSVEIGRAHV